ncbi:uncharacterized protein LOC120844739 [Ixodes scapularis]|uniref:uncharacterized protein LOC120844739 n=1 Tax=Ixodes scapularis TaxID=6945 RepID=UPI001C38CB1C|nr:uncharacterized protein LOC120844739 [Ixodes scapularis]
MDNLSIQATPSVEKKLPPKSRYLLCGATVLACTRNILGSNFVLLADVPHLIKNLNEHLVRGSANVLPADFVTANNLTFPTVSLDPICQPVEFQKNLTFKLAPKLWLELPDPNHFEKMKVSIYSNEDVLLCYSIGKRTLCYAMLVVLPEPTETNHENYGRRRQMAKQR